MTAQLELPFLVDPAVVRAFLTSAVTIDEEQERLREELRLLKENYADVLPLRALSTALKVVRTRRKLAAHPKEPLSEEYQARVEALVAEHLDALDSERAGITAGL